MLSLLRKDFSFSEDHDNSGDESEKRMPMSRPDSNQLAKPEASVHASDKLDPEAVAAFYARAVGMGPQAPACTSGPFSPVAGAGAHHMTANHRAPAWLANANPQPCLASFAPTVERLVRGVAHPTAVAVSQTVNKVEAIPVSPILPCNTLPLVLEQGTVCGQDAHVDVHTPSSLPSVIMETPESFPSYHHAANAPERDCGDVNDTQGPKLALSTSSEFQGFEPGSEKLAPDVDLFIRAESMRVLDTPSGLDVPEIQAQQAASIPHASNTMHQQAKCKPTHEIVKLPWAQSRPPSSSTPVPAKVQDIPQSTGCIQGFGGGIAVANAITAIAVPVQQAQVSRGYVPVSHGCRARVPAVQAQVVTGGVHVTGAGTVTVPAPKQQGVRSGVSVTGTFLAAGPTPRHTGTDTSCEVTPEWVQHNASLPSVIFDTPSDTHTVGQMKMGEHLTGQRSIIFDTPLDSNASNGAAGLNVSNAPGTASVSGQMHMTPNGSRKSTPSDQPALRKPEPVHPNVGTSPGNRRRRQAHAPLDPAFMSASQEQQQNRPYSSSPPYPLNTSLQPAQQIRCPSELQALPSTSDSDGHLPAFQQQHCGAAQAVTPVLRWERKSAELQLSGRVSGHSGEGLAMVPNSSHQGSGKGSAELHTSTTLNGTPPKMPSSSNQQVHNNGSSLLPSDDYSRRLETYVPSVVADVMRRKDGGNMGDSLLHQWQVEVLEQPRVLSGRNVVYSAPTSGGKSLVAEIISLRRLYETNKAILLVLPFVALCNEKASHWEKLLSPLGYSVERYYGGQGRVMSKLPDKAGIAVCTIEKANGLINAMTEAGTLASNLSAVVVDELHMVDDENRGYLLELLLTKLRFAMPSADPASAPGSTRPGSAGSGRGSRPGSVGGSGSPAAQTQAGSMHRTQHGLTQFLGSAAPTIPSQPVGIQLIGMSATLPNVDLIGKWLDAAVHITNFRPVELQMSIFQGTSVHKPNSCNAEVDDWFDEIVDLSKWALPKDPKNPKALIDLDDQKIGYLVEQTVQEQKSVLIFCGTIARVEQTAREITRFSSEGHLDIQERSTFYNSGASPSKREVFIKRLPKSTPDSLRTCLSHGVGYHHGKMMKDHRDSVEAAFKDGVISVLVATSTVATGVNLPAQRVIIRDNYAGKKDNLLSISRLRQMAGRAGRSGIDTKGECVCVLQNTSVSALNRMKRLMTAPPERVSSCLTTEKRGMERIMLEAVATGLVRTAKDILTFIPYTLLAADFEATDLEQEEKEQAEQGDSPSRKQDKEWQQRVADTCKTSLANLAQQGFVFWKKAVARRLSDPAAAEEHGNRRPSISEQGHWAPHKLAAAALRANISPDEALIVNEDVASVAGQLCLESDLHLMYLVAPVKASETLQWQMVYRVVEHAHDHCPVMRAVCKRTGVDMEFARRLGQARKIGFKPEKGQYEQGKRKNPDKKRQLYKMYIALILSEIVNETPLEKIVKIFYPVDKSLVNSESAWTAHVARLEKDIGSLQDEAGRSASMISAFCERIGLTSLELLVSHFHGRVLHGVKEDLVNLTNIKGVRGTTARLLYTAGLETVECIADASDQEIHAALCQGKRASEHQGEWKKARMILKSAIHLLQERAHAAKESLDEATKLLDRKEKENEDRSPLPKKASSPRGTPAAKARSPERQKRLLEPSREPLTKSPIKKHIPTPPLQSAVTNITTHTSRAEPTPSGALPKNETNNTPKHMAWQCDAPVQPMHASKNRNTEILSPQHLKLAEPHQRSAAGIANTLPAASHGTSTLQVSNMQGTVHFPGHHAAGTMNTSGAAPPQIEVKVNAQHVTAWQRASGPGQSTTNAPSSRSDVKSLPVTAAPDLPEDKPLVPEHPMQLITAAPVKTEAAFSTVPMHGPQQADVRKMQLHSHANQHQSYHPQAQNMSAGSAQAGVVNLQRQHRMPWSAQPSAAPQHQSTKRTSNRSESSSSSAAMMANNGNGPQLDHAQQTMHTLRPSTSSIPMQNAPPEVGIAISANSCQQASGVHVAGAQPQPKLSAAVNMPSVHVQHVSTRSLQVPGCAAMQTCMPMKQPSNHSTSLPMPAPHHHAQAAPGSPYTKPSTHASNAIVACASTTPVWPRATSMLNAAPAANTVSVGANTPFMQMPMRGAMQQPQVTAAAHVPVRPAFEMRTPVSPLQMLGKHGGSCPAAGISASNSVLSNAGKVIQQALPASSVSMHQQIKAPPPYGQLQNQSVAQGVHSPPMSPGRKRPAGVDGNGPMQKVMKYPDNAHKHTAGPGAQQQVYPMQQQHIQQHPGAQYAMQSQQWHNHSDHQPLQKAEAKPASSVMASTAPLSIPETTANSRATCEVVQGIKPSSHSEDRILHKTGVAAQTAQTACAQVGPPSGVEPRSADANAQQQEEPSEKALPAAVNPSTAAAPSEKKKKQGALLPDSSASSEEFKAFFDAQPEGLNVVLDDAYMHGLCKAIHACSEVGIELVQCDIVQRQVPVQVNHRLPPTDPVKLKEHHKALQHGSKTALQDAQPKSYTTARGMVVCWDQHRCFFIMMKLKCRQENQKPVCLKYWRQLAEAMESQVTKVGMGMKDMRNHLRDLGWEERMMHKYREEIPTHGLGINLSGQLADVRVAASLLQPGSSIVSDAENTRQFPRENDTDKHRVKKPAQNSKAAAGVQGPAEKLLRLVYQLHGWRTEEWGDPVFPSPASYTPVPSKHSRLSTEVLKPVVEAARELMHVYSLHCQLNPLLEKLELTQVLQKIEWPLGRVLGDMQYRGIPIDVDTVDKQLSDVVAVQEALVEAVAKVAKENGISDFGVPSGSNPKVRELLYDKLKIPPPPEAKNPNAKTDKLSTKAEVLQDMLNHSKDCPKVVEYIMDYRSLCKFREVLDQGDDKSSDLKTLLRTAQPFPISSRSNTGGTLVQVSTSFRQTQGDNGRLSTEKPNVQCAPKPKDFKFPESCNGSYETVHVNLRSIFRAPEGWSFLSADYCQMELRIMAHLAEEDSLISALNQVGPSGNNAGGIDPFTVLAQETGQDRADVKQLFYAVSYGMGVGTLSKKLGCDSNTAARWKQDLLSKFPKIEVWPRGVRKAAAKQGYLCTFAAKRRRWFPHINSSDNTDKGAAERAAVNFTCQAGAADLTKWAMIKVEEGIVEEGLQDSMQMCLQVHDELVFLVRDDRMKQCVQLIRDAMQGAAHARGMWSLLVPMTVKISVGPSWGELTEYK